MAVRVAVIPAVRAAVALAVSVSVCVRVRVVGVRVRVVVVVVAARAVGVRVPVPVLGVQALGHAVLPVGQPVQRLLRAGPYDLGDRRVGQQRTGVQDPGRKLGRRGERGPDQGDVARAEAAAALRSLRRVGVTAVEGDLDPAVVAVLADEPGHPEQIGVLEGTRRGRGDQDGGGVGRLAHRLEGGGTQPRGQVVHGGEGGASTSRPGPSSRLSQRRARAQSAISPGSRPSVIGTTHTGSGEAASAARTASASGRPVCTAPAAEPPS